MNAVVTWLGRQAPDVARTFRRFPLSVALLALGTILVILLANEVFADENSVAGRLALGVLSGTFYAVAGCLLAESRKLPAWLNVTVGWIVPVLVVLALQVESTAWIVALMLPAIGIFWMSVAGFTEVGRGDLRALQQDRFWWLNHRAITTGVVAVAGFLLIALGLVAIDRSLSFLFGIDISDIVYKFILPIAGVFLTPLYWLSNLPPLAEFEPAEIDEPDFLARAIGFLGQFVLSPLLVIYALILLAYALQIVVAGRLPEGLLGWMVLVFIITGTANWLVLHPQFMHRRPMVKWFRRLWFWLTLVPIALYALAVWVRISAYGITEERVLLIAGGVWAALVSLAYLTRLAADIRIIPALAGALLLLIAIGPWNMFGLARWDQLNRLDEAIVAAETSDGFNWSDENAGKARGAIHYLVQRDNDDAPLIALLERHDVEGNWAENISAGDVLTALQIPARVGIDQETFNYLQWSGTNEPALLTGTPLLYPLFQIYNTEPVQAAELNFQLEGRQLKVWRASEDGAVFVDLQVWLDVQSGAQISQPVVTFDLDNLSYKLIVSRATVSFNPAGQDGVEAVTFIEAMLAVSEVVPESLAPEPLSPESLAPEATE